MFDALSPLREAFPEARWVAAPKLHLTMVFLGPTDPARVPTITHGLDRVAGTHGAFEVETGAGGGRARQWRGGVAWIRLGSGGREVASLALALDDALGSATYDAARPPRPHLTVARGVSDGAINALRDWTAARPPLRWWVERVVLMRSHTGHEGSRYEELASADLLTAADGAT